MMILVSSVCVFLVVENVNEIEKKNEEKIFEVDIVATSKEDAKKCG